MSKQKHTSEDDQPSSGYRIVDRLNDLALRIYGAAERSDLDVSGEQHVRRAEQWYAQVQEHFVVEKDEHGNEYLYHRDDSPEAPPTGTERN